MNKRTENYLLDSPETMKKLWMVLCAVCVMVMIPDLFLRREAESGITGFLGFWGGLGFVSCAVLILVCKVLGLVLKVREDHYG
jgi:hypothetical protein